MIKIIRRCQNSRLVEGFHPLFHESVVAPLFVGVCGCFVGVCGCFWVFVGVRGVTICHYLAQTCPWDHLARRNKIYYLIKNDREAVTFVNLTFWIWAKKSSLRHHFCIVIFNILEAPAFQKYSICWVFQAFFLFKWHYHVFCHFIPLLTQVIRREAHAIAYSHNS